MKPWLVGWFVGWLWRYLLIIEALTANMQSTMGENITWSNLAQS